MDAAVQSPVSVVTWFSNVTDCFIDVPLRNKHLISQLTGDLVSFLKADTSVDPNALQPGTCN